MVRDDTVTVGARHRINHYDTLRRVEDFDIKGSL